MNSGKHFVPDAKWPLNQLRIDYKLEKQSSWRPLFIMVEDEAAFLHDLGEHARNLGIVITPSKWGSNKQAAPLNING